MNRKQFLVLLAVLALLAAAGAGVMLSDRTAWKAPDSRIGQKVIAGLKISDVAEIAISDASGELHLVRADGGWRLRERADFPADTDRIGGLLVKLAELKIVQAESLPESQRARLQLADPKDAAAAGAATLLELKDGKGQSLARLLLGKTVLKKSEVPVPGGGDSVPAGRYLLAGGDAATVLTVSEPFALVEPKPELWLVRDLIRVDRAKTITATGGDGKPRWQVTRETDAGLWKLAGASEKADLQKLQDVAGALYSITLADVVADPSKADTGLDKPVTIRAETFDGATYTLRIGNRDKDRYYVGVDVAGEPTRQSSSARPAKTRSPRTRKRKTRNSPITLKRLRRTSRREKSSVAGPISSPRARSRRCCASAQLLAEPKKDENKKDQDIEGTRRKTLTASPAAARAMNGARPSRKCLKRPRT